MSDFKSGVTVPPFHPNCHCVTVPYIDDEFREIFGEGERAARDENGKTISVPEDMTYPEWKKVFVDKSQTMDEWTAAKKGVARFETGSQAMAKNNVDWSKTKPIKHSEEEFAELKEYAEKINMQVYNETKFDGDMELLKEQMSTIHNILNEYRIKKRITISFSDMEDDDFAKTMNGKTVFFNTKALRDKSITNDIMNADNHLASSDIKGIGAHECGHIISSQYGEKGLEIARQAYYNIYKEEISYIKLIDKLEDIISFYSVQINPMYEDKPFKLHYYKEVLPEILAKDKTNGNEFTKEFVRLLKGAIL